MVRRGTFMAGGVASLLLGLGACGEEGVAPPPLSAEQDRQIVFSTYLGGKDVDQVRGLTVDGQGNIYLTGGTTSSDFVATPGCAQRRHGGSMDAFVTKMDPAGRIQWSTFLGGENYDRAYGICVGRDGSVYVGGRAGAGFPVTAGAAQERFAGDEDPITGYGQQDGFVARIAADGSRVLWATYFGEPGRAVVRELDVDGEGGVYLVLNEVSRACAHVSPDALYSKLGAGPESLVAKVSADGRKILWATYIGGSGNDVATSIRVDSQGNVGVAGATDSPDFPTTEGAFSRTPQGQADAFALKLSPDGKALGWSAVFGGRGADGAAGVRGLALDREDNFLVAGYTFSPDFPVTERAAQKTYAGGQHGRWDQTGDMFVVRIAADGRRLLASTFLGGGAQDGGEGIAVDREGRILLSGSTWSTDFPVSGDACQAENHGGSDGLIVLVSADLSRIEYATYFGGRSDDQFRSCGVDAGGGLIAAGGTLSFDFPVKGGSQMRFRSAGDAVVVKIRRGP